MKVLILGGTGAIGRFLAKKLSIKNNVSVTSRQIKTSNGKIKYIKGNAIEIDFLKIVLSEKYDVIVDFMNYKTVDFIIRYKLLLDSCSQYIFLSSSRVYSNTDSKISENDHRLINKCKNDKYLNSFDYALEKANQEDLISNSGRSNWTIIRPYITFNEERLQLGNLEKEAWLYRAINGRTIIFNKKISEKITTLTYGEDVSSAIYSLINNPEALSNIFHITSNENYKWKKICETYLNTFEEVLGFKPKIILMQDDKLYKSHNNEFQVEYDRFFNRSFNNKKINKFINVDDFENTLTCISSCLRIFLKNPKFKSIYWPQEAIRDKISLDHTPLSEIDNLKDKLMYLIIRYIKPL